MDVDLPPPDLMDGFAERGAAEIAASEASSSSASALFAAEADEGAAVLGGLASTNQSQFELLAEATDATVHAARLWVKLARPYVVWLCRSLYAWSIGTFRYARRTYLDLDEETQKSILLAVAGVVLLLALKRLAERSKVAAIIRGRVARVSRSARQRWRAIHARVSSFSKVLADLLPHIAFVVAFAAYAWLVPRGYRRVIESEAVFFTLTKLYPVISSAPACIAPQKSAGEGGRGASLANVDASQALLRMWVCFYIWEVADDLPLVSALVRYTAYDAVAAFRLFYALWVVAPLTDGAGKVCGMLTVRPRRERENRFQTFARQCLSFGASAGLIPLIVQSIVSDLVTNWMQLLCLLFVLTPGFLTYYGCVISGKILPAKESLRVAASRDKRDPGGLHERARLWLVYWTVFAVLDTLHHIASTFVGWLPLWYHTELLGILWLQLPYFGGAARIFRSLDEGTVLRICAYFPSVPKVKAIAKTKKKAS